MTEDVFDKVLRDIELPIGQLLEDGKTYLIEGDVLRNIPGHQKDLKAFDRCLVLSDGDGRVVGGVLFYGSYDLQAQMLPEYKGRGYMSAIHRNGILEKCLYPNQRVTICMEMSDSAEDALMKRHLLSLIGLTEANQDSINNWIIQKTGQRRNT